MNSYEYFGFVSLEYWTDYLLNHYLALNIDREDIQSIGWVMYFITVIMISVILWVLLNRILSLRFGNRTYTVIVTAENHIPSRKIRISEDGINILFTVMFNYQQICIKSTLTRPGFYWEGNVMRVESGLTKEDRSLRERDDKKLRDYLSSGILFELELDREKPYLAHLSYKGEKKDAKYGHVHLIWITSNFSLSNNGRIDRNDVKEMLSVSIPLTKRLAEFTRESAEANDSTLNDNNLNLNEDVD